MSARADAKQARADAKQAREREQWFMQTVVKPARAEWGSGWDRLSVEQKITEVQAKAWAVLTASGRIEDAATNSEEAAVLGRHVLHIFEAFRAWRQGFEELHRELAEIRGGAE